MTVPKKVYALLVGIDDYPDPVPALTGCGNDVRHLERFLRARLGDGVEVMTLLDEAATRDAVVAAFRTHVGRAGQSDVALFAFNGHGSEELAPPELATSEQSGRLQNLMLHDAGRSVDGQVIWPLADKELRSLLETVAATGAHTVAILDCCHSGDATRDVDRTLRQWVPPDPADVDDPATRSMVAALQGPRPAEAFLDGALRAGSDAEVRHIALYACQSKQTAGEETVGGERRGLFSASLIDALTAVNSSATYRQVFAATRSRMELGTSRQLPDLFPETLGGAADAAFLDGTVRLAPASFVMTPLAGGWTIDAGSMHGLDAPVGGQAFELACTSVDGTPRGNVRVVSVQPASADVEPIDWRPDESVYDAVVIRRPVPLAEVEFVPASDAVAADALGRIRVALAEEASSSTRELPVGAVPTGLVLRVRFDGSGTVRVERADGSPAVPASLQAIDSADVAGIVEQLDHVARWERVKNLSNPTSGLAEGITVRVYRGEPGEAEIPADREPMAPGEYLFEGSPGDTVHFWCRVTNDSGRSDLNVAWLDLDERLACSVMTEGAQFRGKVWDEQFSFAVPERGETTHEWFTFLVADFAFATAPFVLPPLGAAPPPAATSRAVTLVARPIEPDWCALGLSFVFRGV